VTRLLTVLGEAVDRLGRELGTSPRLLVAFSGGPDSTALLWGLASIRQRVEFELQAAHLDHGMDPGSNDRAGHALELARTVGVRCHVQRLEVPRLRRQGESLEATARRVRYEFLERVAEREQLEWILTAHHREDQVETIVLRMLFGTGWQGLSGIARRRGRVVRPLIDLTRSQLNAALADSGLRPNNDPTNLDPRHPRSRIRHHLIAQLEAELPDLQDRLLRLSRRSDAARSSLERRLERSLRLERSETGASVRFDSMESLPSEVRRVALALVARACQCRLPPSSASIRELERQIADGGALQVDCGRGWRWVRRGTRLWLERSASEIAEFQYTVRVPGETEIPEAGLRMRIRRATMEPWMKRGAKRRAALSLPLRPGDRVTVRNRRPGDRLRPLGAPGRRRLKEVLIDRKVPRAKRDRLPLLVWRERIAWVPGVTVDEAFRLVPGSPVWVAELEPTGISPVAELLNEQPDP